MATQNKLAEQITSPEFQRWFKGSSLVNSDGQPLILYHGTRPGVEFSEFSQPDHDGTYFTPCPLYAEGFTDELFGDDASSGQIMPVYLSVKNPFVVTADPEDGDWESFVYRGYDREKLIAEGYDGAILIEKSTGVIDQVQAYYPEQVKSAIGNVGTFDPTTPDIRFARTDPRYMFVGPQSETSDLQLFDRARQLEKKKLSTRHIWNETGWLRGVDGKWRYEINDADATLKIGIPDWLKDDVSRRVDECVVISAHRETMVKATYDKGGVDYLAAFGHTAEEATANLKTHLANHEFEGVVSVDRMGASFFELRQVLDHPRLFAAYPRLAEMMVQFDSELPEQIGGVFSHDLGISLNPSRPHDKILNTLLHEVQHAIQETEGFAYGGQPEKAFTDGLKQGLESLSREHRDQVSAWADYHSDKLDGQQATSDMITYGLMYQSMQRLISYANRDKPSGVLRLIRSEMSWAYHPMIRESDVAREFDEADRNWYNLPKRHKLPARNIFLREQCAEAARLLGEIIPPSIRNSFRKDDRQLKSILKSLERSAEKARKELAPYRRLTQEQKTAENLEEHHRYNSPYGIYRSLAGEIESRNTEARRTMTEVERQATLPERTADIPDDQAIVIFRDRNSYTVEVPFRSASASSAFSTRATTSKAKRLSKEEAQHICDGLMTSWAGKPPLYVVDQIKELPAPLQQHIYQKRAVEDVQAAFYDESVYLVASRLPDRSSLEEVLLHEIIGHYGLRKVLDNRFQDTLEGVYKAMAETDLGRTVTASYFPEGDFDSGSADDRQLVAEEIMAHLAESGDYRKLSDSGRYESEVRSGLRALGFELPLTRPDLQAILQGAEDVVKNGGLAKPGDSSVCFRRVFHGSPHQFDRFSLDAVGNGEGAQAYGWGLYFAGHPGVAQFYQRVLGRSQVSVNGVEVPNVMGGHIDREALSTAIQAATGAPERDAERLVRLFNIGGKPFSTEAVHEELSRRVADYRDFGSHDAADQMESLRPYVERLVVEPVQGGHVYEVEIPDDEHFLDYDAPLNKQSASIQAALSACPLTGRESNGWRNAPPGMFEHAVLSRTGAEVQGILFGILGSPRKVSEHLASLGIPGLRYLDGDSRDSNVDDQTTRNYIVWDESVVSVQAINDQAVQAGVQPPATHPELMSADALALMESLAVKSDAYEEVPAVSQAKLADLHDKAMYAYRFLMLNKLSEFDAIAPVGGDAQLLSGQWKDCHAAHFHTHDAAARRLGVSGWKLFERYSDELASHGYSIKGAGWQRIDEAAAEVPDFLEAVSGGSGVVAQRAKRSLSAWRAGHPPFEHRPSAATQGTGWASKANQGNIDSLRFTKDHCPAPSVAVWASLALTRQAVVRACGELPVDSQLAAAISIGLPIMTALPNRTKQADASGAQHDSGSAYDPLMEHYPFMHDVIIDALDEIRQEPESRAAFSEVLASSDTASRGALERYLSQHGHSDLARLMPVVPPASGENAGDDSTPGPSMS